MYSVLGTDLRPSPAVIHLFIATMYEAASGIIRVLDPRKPRHGKAN